MIASGNHVDAQFKEFFGDLWSDTKAAGGVFAVRHRQLDAALLLQFRQALVHNSAAWPRENVTDEKYAHVRYNSWTRPIGTPNLDANTALNADFAGNCPRQSASLAVLRKS